MMLCTPVYYMLMLQSIFFITGGGQNKLERFEACLFSDSRIFYRSQYIVLLLWVSLVLNYKQIASIFKTEAMGII
jgi:hypothetical protein